MSSSPRIAISLGASFMGYATHAGFLARLQSLGVRPVAIGGSSAGAITAGLFAAGLGQEAIRQAVLSPRLYLSFASRTKWLWHQFINSFFHRHPGFFDPRGAVPHFESLVGDRTIESLSDPQLLIALSDLSKHETLFVRSGPLAAAMAASACVPLMFTPLEFEGRHCTDGGVAHESPVDPWFTDDSIDHIIIHRIVQPQSKPPLMPLSRLMATVAATHASLNRQILLDRIELARLHGKKLTVITTDHARPSPLFPGKLKELYAMGEDTAQKFFDSEHLAGQP
ncbi:patatin-like phospholipase family protein [Prosthecobacter sp.]|uniref:patatin-like phospholipase family protein n=1 Tax=Prosthecobacter sp. TaxID=1965333 RepID=UPI003784B8BC